MNLYLLIGGTGQGKSTLAQKLIGNKPCLVYDVQNEYQHLQFNNEATHSRFIGLPSAFLTLADKKVDTWILFEEATSFLEGKTKLILKNIVISKRHRKCNLVFLFHTIGSVPPFILDTANYIILFKTGDDIKTVQQKRGKLVKPFLRLQRAAKYEKEIIKNQ